MFVVYDNSQTNSGAHPIVGVYLTLAKAQAKAAKRDSWVAPTNQIAATNAAPQWWYVLSLTDAREVWPVQTDAEKVRVLTLPVHDQLLAWAAWLASFPHLSARGEKFLRCIHRCYEHDMNRSDLTLAQKTAISASLPQGALDVPDPPAFAENIDLFPQDPPDFALRYWNDDGDRLNLTAAEYYNGQGGRPNVPLTDAHQLYKLVEIT